MDRARIEHLARLAGLELTPAECDRLAGDLARLDALVAALPPLPADAGADGGREPPRHPLPPCPWDPAAPPARLVPGALLDLPAPAAEVLDAEDEP